MRICAFSSPGATAVGRAHAGHKGRASPAQAHTSRQRAASTLAASTLLAASVALTAPMALAEITPVYFGNGCFWGRQKDFVDTEASMGRKPEQSTAKVGYAGGQENSRPVCYYYNAPDTQYEKQGHAEVVQVGVDQAQAQEQMAMFAKTYFNQFQKTNRGMQRSDPQDRGPGYRNVVGIPGGLDSDLGKAFASQNSNRMRLVKGQGNTYKNGKPTEDDVLNTVFVVDSTQLPFHQAESWHQYHPGIGKSFPREYLVDLKISKKKQGEIDNIPGCIEYPF